MTPGTGEFPAQMASNAENVSIWWRHHEVLALWSGPTHHINCGSVVKSWDKPHHFVPGIHRVFVLEIHWLPMESQHKWLVMYGLYAFFVVSLDEDVNKPSTGYWNETP